MRKSSVGSAVLGLLAVTVASIGATGVLMLLPFSNDRALFGCAGAITAVLYFGYGRWIGSRQSAKTAGLVMILAAAVQVLWLVVLYGAVPEWLLGIAGCALPFAALVDGGTGSRELLALVPAFWQCAVFTAGGLEPTAAEKVQIEVMMKKGTAVPNCGSFCILRYLTVKKLPYSGSLRME